MDGSVNVTFRAKRDGVSGSVGVVSLYKSYYV